MSDADNFKAIFGRLMDQIVQLSSQVAQLSTALTLLASDKLGSPMDSSPPPDNIHDGPPHLSPYLQDSDAHTALIKIPSSSPMIYSDFSFLPSAVLPGCDPEPSCALTSIDAHAFCPLGHSPSTLENCAASLSFAASAFPEEFNFLQESHRPCPLKPPMALNPPCELVPLRRKLIRRRRLSGPLKVLVVEDDPLCQQLLRRLFGSMSSIPGGHNLQIVADGTDAIILMSTGNFDLVLMDMQLPTLDGMQATKSIRKFNRRTPIVSMTAHVAKSDVEKYLAVGMNDVLPKPFNSQSLLETIEHFYKLSLEEDPNPSSPPIGALRKHHKRVRHC